MMNKMMSQSFDPIAYIEKLYTIYGFGEDDIRNAVIDYMEETDAFKEWDICQ